MCAVKPHIYPSQLFATIAASAERDIKGLFADFDTTSNRHGNTVKDKNLRLAAVLKGVADLNSRTRSLARTNDANILLSK